MKKHDFHLSSGSYLLNHSVGRPLKSLQQAFQQAYLSPWQDQGREPWSDWLNVISKFNQALAKLFNSKAELFCPQVNLSSALTKILMSQPKLANKPKVLMSEIDFPSMGFALQKSVNADITFLPKETNVTEFDNWAEYLTDEFDLVFVSHAYSNTGQCSPVKQIVDLAKQKNVLSIVDVAQSAGVIPFDLTDISPDFLIGSSVKWLCGGPGAAYLWLSQTQLAICQPIDVGWFSHQNPFEFDIHHFEYNDTALKFWGGTPSIAPYAFAAHSIEYFAELGSASVNQHNRKLQNQLISALTSFVVSPKEEIKRSGTVILNFDDNQYILEKLTRSNIAVDVRSSGIRVSPHIYNDENDIKDLIAILINN